MRIKENLKQNKAITLVAMTITIIIILILTSIIIIQLRNNGILKNTKMAKEKFTNSQKDENETIDDYSNQIENYKIAGNGRDTITINKNEYEDLKNKVNFLYNGITNLKYNNIVSSNINVPYNTSVTIYEKEFTEDKLICLSLIGDYDGYSSYSINYGFLMYLNNKEIARNFQGEIKGVDSAAYPNVSQVIYVNKGDKLNIRLYQAGNAGTVNIKYNIYVNI